MVESRPTSDRSSLRIERAYFTHPSLCLRHYVFQYNSRWTSHGIWAESTRARLNHSFQSQIGGECGFLICVSFVWQDPSLIYHRSVFVDRSVLCFYGFNDCNSVHYQCEQKSVMLILCLHLLPIDNVFLRRRNARWWTTVYVCLHGPYARTWWEQLDSFSGHNHPDHIHRRCYAISREWNITNSLGACKFVISSNASWYSKKLMNRVDFSAPPLRGCKWC